jgi:putative ABC transport system ATP-binding protein
MTQKYIIIKNLKKSFENGRIKALRGVNLELAKHDFVAIMGPSGCGKSTLLNMIGALDRPDVGEIIVSGQNLREMRDLSKFRAHKVGFIFQLHNLIPTLTALENVQVPMFETKIRTSVRKKKAKNLLQLVGLIGRDNSLPTKLSGGERQRVAVARALANDPEILIADEPTGSLDSKSAKEILELLQEIHRKTANTIIVVTHDKTVASYADQIIQMKDGKIK